MDTCKKLAFQFFTDSQAVRIKPEVKELCCVSPILRPKVPVRLLKDFSIYPDDWSPLLLSFSKNYSAAPHFGFCLSLGAHPKLRQFKNFIGILSFTFFLCVMLFYPITTPYCLCFKL
jgi:hypothetical protein